MKSFTEYKAALWAWRSDVEALLAKDHPLGKLEHFSNRLLYKLDPGYGGGLSEVKTDQERVIASLVVKLSNELISFLWAIRGGSLWGANTHIRSFLEIVLASEYISARNSKKKVTKKRSERIRKYLEYSDAGRLAHIQRESLSKDSIIALTGSWAAYEQLLKGEDAWCKLYEVKELTELFHWHSPAPIDSLFERTNKPEALRRIYAGYCHATHVSPIGYKTAGTNPMLIGFSAENVEKAAFSAWICVCELLVSLEAFDESGLLKSIWEDARVLAREVGPMYRASKLDR